MKIKQLCRELRQISCLKTIYYNFLEKKVKRNNGILIVYKGVSLCLEDGASLHINGGKLFLGRTNGTGMRTIVRIQKESNMIIYGDTTIEYGADILLKPNAELVINNNCYFNCRAMIRCHKKITLGEDVLISSDIDLRDSDGHALNGMCKTEGVSIGNHVWIGNHVGILKGVNIGDGCMIGAKALITHDIPPNCLAYGIPAAVHKENIFWK